MRKYNYSRLLAVSYSETLSVLSNYYEQPGKFTSRFMFEIIGGVVNVEDSAESGFLNIKLRISTGL